MCFEKVVGMERFDATGGASPSPTKSERDSAGLGGLVQARDSGVAIPPVVARILSGDSTSPLTREASLVVQGKAMDVLLRKLLGWRGSMQREGQASPLRKARGIVWVWEGWCK